MERNETHSTDRYEAVLQERRERAENARLLRHHRKLNRISAFCLLLTSSAFGVHEWQKRHPAPPEAVVISAAPRVITANPVEFTAALPMVTQSTCDALRINMTRTQALRLVKIPYTKNSRTDIKIASRSSSKETMVWANPDGTSLTLSFQNDVLISKQSSGLQ